MLDTVHRDAASLEHFVVSADFRQALLLPEQTSTVGRCRRCENIFVTLDGGIPRVISFSGVYKVEGHVFLPFKCTGGPRNNQRTA